MPLLARDSEGAVVIHPDGNVEVIALPAATSARLQAMYKTIGCTNVDVVRLSNKLDMWLDGEGMYTSPVNAPATLLARRFGRIHQDYFGTVIIAGFTAAGETINLNCSQLTQVLTALDDVAAAL